MFLVYCISPILILEIVKKEQFKNLKINNSKIVKENIMTYIVNDKCIMCKHTDCVEVCPVDCFYEGENMLVIHPDECIDCGVCEPECPPEAILPDSEEGTEDWVNFNRKYSEIWPNITQLKDPMKEADKFLNEENKFNLYFSEKPGEGD